MIRLAPVTVLTSTTKRPGWMHVYLRLRNQPSFTVTGARREPARCGAARLSTHREEKPREQRGEHAPREQAPREQAHHGH